MKYPRQNYASVLSAASGAASACHCIGPQNGQPVCPCEMRGVEIRNGRYVRVTDLGAVPSGLVGIPRGEEHKCGKCQTCYFQKQECDWCPGQQTS